jgi:hypothetical protein
MKFNHKDKLSDIISDFLEDNSITPKEFYEIFIENVAIVVEYNEKQKQKEKAQKLFNLIRGSSIIENIGFGKIYS